MFTQEPLAYRMRPRTIEEVIGQDDVIGPHTALYRMIKNGYVPSLLLYGQPGVGKTSLAYAIAGTMQRPFYALNATTAGKKEIEEIVADARFEGNVILFIDEIHRFTKAQQDYLLPHVENGLITLIGATTENPFHSINPAVRSRLGQMKQLQPLTKEKTIELLHRALTDRERGLGKWYIDISDEALALIAEGANGDARVALTILEEAVYATKQGEHRAVVDAHTVSFCVEKRALTYDKQGDTYYSLLSALQKSVRGSDVDAALHYLARLLEGGDMTAVCRRLAVIAYEDIGLANPLIGVKVMSAIEAAERLGMPEARIPLSVVTIEMCLSPKSNSAYEALDQALADVRSGKGQSIPLHLQDAHYAGAKHLGRGIGYKYPHDYPYGWVAQQYLPDDLIGVRYYEPKRNGEEKQLASVYERLNERKKQ